MMKHPLFTLFGLALIGSASMAEYYGWGLFSRADRSRVENPRSVRDNPGIYRSMYRGYTRYSGGK
jgi:hypothetical protein